MQTIKSKRIKYDPPTYARLLDELTQIMNSVPHLQADRETWDIDGDDWRSTGTMHFVDAAFQDQFKPYTHFDCRTIKIVNFGKPAVRMTFYKKHRYWLVRDSNMTTEDKKKLIQEYINKLTVDIDRLAHQAVKRAGFELTKARDQIAMMQSQLSSWSDVLANLSEYELALSNYHREHYYLYINYKFRNPDDSYANEQIHLLNPQKDSLNTIIQVRHNIVFIDPHEIRRDHPYQNKDIDGFLDRFPMVSTLGRNQIYARPRPLIDSVAAFEQQVSQQPVKAPIVPKKPRKRPKMGNTSPSLPLFDDF